jgi:hypothetical protein
MWDDWVTDARSAYLSFVVCHAFMAYIVYDLMHGLSWVCWTLWFTTASSSGVP